MKHTMFDLETLGTRAGCVIASIGAVEFDPQAGTLGRNYYGLINMQSCMDARLRVDASTVQWWLKQSEAARKELCQEGFPLKTVLTTFGQWLDPESMLWSHGCSFDVPILETAYHAVKVPVPWKFWNIRDSRTLFDVLGVTVDRSRGTHHNALDDSKAQALAVGQALRKLAGK